MNNPLNALPGYLMRRASNALQDEFVALLSALGLRASDASTLFLIEANPDITPSALGNLLGIQRANMVPIVARLEKANLIQRVPLDGRSYGVNFTSEGQDMYKKVNHVIKQHEAEIISRIPPESREHFVAALEALWPENPAEPV